jgi:phage terminase large subunit
LSTAERIVINYEPRGAALALFNAREREVVLAGPAGTGKTRGSLEYVHWCASEFPRMRGLLLRKTLVDLTSSALVTFREKVLHPAEGVRFFSGNRERPAAYQYPNGSELVVGGLDKASKVLSSEYDLIYVNQAEELDEAEWETLTMRARYGVMPWQQVLADANPGPPTHWLLARANRGMLRMLESRHDDNPAVTPEYLAALDALTGIRHARYRLGLWAAAEGMVYDEYDPVVHLVDPFPIPATWKRYWSIDFGYTNPFVCQWWAEDGDGRLYRYRELYMSQRLVEDHAEEVKKFSAGEPRPQAIICDHDAEGRATLERHLGMKTIAAKKAISDGIQAVQARLRKAGDGKPRLFFFRDATVERDRILADKKLPTSTEGEIESYVWDVSNGRKKGETPVDADNHGMDCLRYMVAECDVKTKREVRVL